MDFKEVPGFYAKLREVDTAAARALRFTILTAARAGETRECVAREINLGDAIWTVPANRMYPYGLAYYG
jgi:hypothetical protein